MPLSLPEDTGIPVCISLWPLHSLFVYGSSEEVGYLSL